MADILIESGFDINAQNGEGNKYLLNLQVYK